jgi:uncharacterized membrane protein SirB2
VRRWRPNWSHVQDTVVFLIGAGIVLHDTFVTNLDRQWLIALAAAMMGLPGFRHLDLRRNRSRDRSEDE